MKAAFLFTAALSAVTFPAMAEDMPPATAKPQGDAKAPEKEVFSTGVAKGRDRLDSATSTSALKGSEIEKLGPRPLADILRTLPGLRVESAVGEGNANYTVRGLPLAAGGSKYVQLQEEGLPAVEFGDIFNVAADVFLRNDFNLAAVETIRGGSASTFASDSPGGLINLISKTGDVAGGAVQVTGGWITTRSASTSTMAARWAAAGAFTSAVSTGRARARATSASTATRAGRSS